MPTDAPLTLILNGSCLRHGFTGVGTYLRLLCLALEQHQPALAWKLAVPLPFRDQADFLPAHRILAIPGPTSIHGAARADLLWDTLIAAHALRHYPRAIFHSPFHFWAPLHPRLLVITAHDCIEQRFPSVAQNTRLGRLHRRLCWHKARRARAIIAVSHSTKNDLVALARIPAEKITVIHNWPDPACRPQSADALAALRARLGLPERYIAYLGGYRSYKNVAQLIAAWDLARRSDPSTPALVLGGAVPENTHHGFYADIRGAIAQSAHSAEIHLPGSVSEEDLPGFYAGAALFVSPSLYEGFGYPAVEALACGTPVIVSDCSSYQELFPAPSRFAPDSTSALQDKILHALRNPDSFRHPVDRRFSSENGAKNYAACFAQLV